MSSSVSALVLNYRTPLQAVRCVQALRAQTLPPDEILVIDNHSDDESSGILRNRLEGMPGVRVLENRTNAGYAAGNNLALAQATGEFLLITNPDNELESEGLERMVEAMQESDIGVVAPKLVHEDGSIRASVRRFPSPSDVIAKRAGLERAFPSRVARYLGVDSDPNAPRDVDWAVGACLLVRRQTLKDVGMFDERFFLFFEDMDFCRRCWTAGWRVAYRPGAVARDRKRRLSDGNLFTLAARRVGRAHIASALKYFWKWRGVALPRG